METFLVILGAIGIILFPFILGLLLYAILHFVHNKTANKLLKFVFCILFLPAMMAVNGMASVTDEDRKLGIFSYDVHTNSRALLVVYAIYVAIYYLIYSRFFK